jgi:hypothetical protein
MDAHSVTAIVFNQLLFMFNHTLNHSLKKAHALTLLITLIGFTQLLHAQTNTNTITTAVPFLLISPDSRAGGMGEANVAIADNSAAVFWNPAGLGYQRGTDFNLSYSRWLPVFNADLYYLNWTGKYYSKGVGTFGGAITFLSLGESEFTDATGNSLGRFSSYEVALSISYGVKVAKTLSLGGSLRYIRSQLTPSSVLVGRETQSGVGNSVSMDIATLWRPSERFSFGMNLSNVGPKMTYIDQAQADPLPTNFKVGFAFRLVNSRFNKLTIATDFNKLLVKRTLVETRIPIANRSDSVAVSTRTDNVLTALFSSWGGDQGLRSFTIGIGTEYWYGDPGIFAIRGGYFYEDPNYGGRRYLTFGFGLRYSLFGLDFSYLNSVEEQHPLNGTVRLSVGVLLGGNAVSNSSPKTL